MIWQQILGVFNGWLARVCWKSGYIYNVWYIYIYDILIYGLESILLARGRTPIFFVFLCVVLKSLESIHPKCWIGNIEATQYKTCHSCHHAHSCKATSLVRESFYNIFCFAMDDWDFQADGGLCTSELYTVNTLLDVHSVYMFIIVSASSTCLFLYLLNWFMQKFTLVYTPLLQTPFGIDGRHYPYEKLLPCFLSSNMFQLYLLCFVVSSLLSQRRVFHHHWFGVANVFTCILMKIAFGKNKNFLQQFGQCKTYYPGAFCG